MPSYISSEQARRFIHERQGTSTTHASTTATPAALERHGLRRFRSFAGRWKRHAARRGRAQRGGIRGDAEAIERRDDDEESEREHRAGASRHRTERARGPVRDERCGAVF